MPQMNTKITSLHAATCRFTLFSRRPRNEDGQLDYGGLSPDGGFLCQIDAQTRSSDSSVIYPLTPQKCTQGGNPGYSLDLCDLLSQSPVGSISIAPGVTEVARLINLFADCISTRLSILFGSVSCRASKSPLLPQKTFQNDSIIMTMLLISIHGTDSEWLAD
jgi:hypothetical protein